MINKNDVDKRHDSIREIINKNAVSDQNQIVKLLKEKYHIEANQTVVSRDLRKLSVVKKMVNGSLVYEMPNIDTTTEILRLALVDIVHNESMIVIKTRSGLADFVGDCVDDHDDLDVLGCLAGENVVFVTPKSIKNIKKTFQKVCEKFHFKKKKDSSSV